MGVPTIQWIPDCARSLQPRSLVRQCGLTHIRSAPPKLLTHKTVNVCPVFRNWECDTDNPSRVPPQDKGREQLGLVEVSMKLNVMDHPRGIALAVAVIANPHRDWLYVKTPGHNGTLTGALVWPLASALNLLNRHVRVPLMSPGAGSIVYFWAGKAICGRKSVSCAQRSVVGGRITSRELA